MKYLALCIVLLFAGTAYAQTSLSTKVYECIRIMDKDKLIAQINDIGETF